MLEDCERALKDLDKADVFEQSNAFILQIHGDVKRMLKDYQGALEDLHKANVFETKDTFILQSYRPIKRC
jgi:hypothetical protein